MSISHREKTNLISSVSNESEKDKTIFFGNKQNNHFAGPKILLFSESHEELGSIQKVQIKLVCMRCYENSNPFARACIIRINLIKWRILKIIIIKRCVYSICVLCHNKFFFNI